jgi:D-alanyl-D-alanine carboxypeptidase
LTVVLAETHDRYFQPGAGFHYSNTNYQVAAMVLEEISGRSLADLVEERISRPLNLSQTTLAPDDLRSPAFRGNAVDTATGEFIDATDDLFAFGNGGSGGLLSTADELTTIMSAVVNGPLLPADLRAEMIRPTPQSGDSYGLGIATYSLRCGVFYGHGGSVNGTTSIVLVDGSGRSVVAAFNRTGGDPHLVTLAEQLVCPPTPTS